MSNRARINGTSLRWFNGGTDRVVLTPGNDILTLSGDGGSDVELRGIAPPTQATSAVNKNYVDSLTQGIKWKDSVRVASTSANSATAIATYIVGFVVDGIALADGDRILIKDSSVAVNNGIYEIDSGASPQAQRTVDYASGSSAVSTAVLVEEGTQNGDVGFVCTNDNGSGIVGTDGLVFTQFTTVGEVIGGDGLDKTGNTLSVNVDNSTIEISTDTLQIKDSGVTNAKLANSGVTLTAGDGLSTTNSSLDLGTTATLSVNVDDSTVEINTDTVRVKANGIGENELDFGLSAGQVDLSSIPLNTFSWAQVSAPSNSEDALQKIDGILDDIITGTTTISLADGIATRGGSGSVDVAVDDSTIEVFGSVGSDVLRLKDGGILNAKIADSTIQNAKLANNEITVSAGTGLNTTGANIALGATSTLSVDFTEVVRTSTNQSVAGIKTFSDTTNSTATTNGALIVSGGVGIANDVNVGGDVFALAFEATSDERRKKNISSLGSMTDVVKKMRLVSYNWKHEDDKLPKKAGIIAQELVKLIPDAVKTDKEGMHTVDYNHVFSVVTKSLQEVIGKLENLEKEHQELKSKYEKLKFEQSKPIKV